MDTSMLSYRFFNDFACLLLVFTTIVKSKGIREAIKQKLSVLVVRIAKNEVYFKDTQVGNNLKAIQDLINNLSSRF